jgi:hypothetical protein
VSAVSALPTWAFVSACLLIPAAWGAFTAWAFTRRDQRAVAARRAAGPGNQAQALATLAPESAPGSDRDDDDRDRRPPVDYMI